MDREIEEVYTWRAWECPRCGGQNDYDATKETGKDIHECIHCEEKVIIDE